LINQADGVEKYIQVRGQQVKLVVYNRQTEECAIGTLNGEIATLHIRPAHIDEKLNGIDDLIEKGEILRIN
jgi:hypothetical protein